ncbi:hypothetical protein LCH29_26715 [Streptomyces sp. BRA346]
MCRQYAAGRTLQEIGETFGVSGERVRQIVSNWSDAVSASDARSARREARAEQLTSQVNKFLTVHREGIAKLAEAGASRSDVEARFALLFPEVDAVVVREAIASAKVLFDVDVQEFAFSTTAIEAAVWYALAREQGLTGDRHGAARDMDLDDMEETGQALLRAGVEPMAVAEILGLIHAAQELVRSGAEVGISAARYNARRESVLEELGMESQKGARPWPPTSQTVMKRLGAGSWAKAQVALDLTPDSRGRPEGCCCSNPGTILRPSRTSSATPSPLAVQPPSRGTPLGLRQKSAPVAGVRPQSPYASTTGGGPLRSGLRSPTVPRFPPPGQESGLAPHRRRQRCTTPSRRSNGSS